MSAPMQDQVLGETMDRQESVSSSLFNECYCGFQWSCKHDLCLKPSNLGDCGSPDCDGDIEVHCDLPDCTLPECDALLCEPCEPCEPCVTVPCNLSGDHCNAGVYSSSGAGHEICYTKASDMTDYACGQCSFDSQSSICCTAAVSSCSSAVSSPVLTPVNEAIRQCDHANSAQHGKLCHWGDDCSFAFSSLEDLDSHLRTTHISFLEHLHREDCRQKDNCSHSVADSNIQQQHCLWDSCGVVTDELDALLAHVKMEHVAPTVNSQSHFTNASAVQLTDTSEKPIQCHWNNCTDMYSDVSALDTHLASHLDSNQLQCEWDACSFTTLTSDNLLSHIANTHVLPLDGFQGLSEWHGESSLRSHQHQLINEQSQHQNQHQHQHGTNQYISCHPQSLHYHMHAHQHHSADHVDETQHSQSHYYKNQELKRGNPETVKQHQCLWTTDDTVCGEIFDTAQALSEHVSNMHVGSRKQTYVCYWKGCDRSCRPFHQRQKIIRHLQIHTQNRPYVCEVCGKRFAEQIVLTQHLRVHSGEKPHECKICGKKFAASTALSVHIRVHTGDKPLKCRWPGCTRSFSESSNLAKHMRTHRAEKRFRCTAYGCEKSFLRHDQLVRHMRTHANNSINKVQSMPLIAGITDVKVDSSS
ncbi:hypothetical protein V1511DRAFT_486918 [Dipodascopsis uninucleata]